MQRLRKITKTEKSGEKLRRHTHKQQVSQSCQTVDRRVSVMPYVRVIIEQFEKAIEYTEDPVVSPLFS